MPSPVSKRVDRQVYTLTSVSNDLRAERLIWRLTTFYQS